MTSRDRGGREGSARGASRTRAGSDRTGRRRSGLLLLGLLLPGLLACGGPKAGQRGERSADAATALPPLERGVVVDAPVPSDAAPTRTRPPAPSPVPMQNDAFATELVAALTGATPSAAAASPAAGEPGEQASGDATDRGAIDGSPIEEGRGERIGAVVELRPVDCGAIRLRAGDPVDCAGPRLRAGRYGAAEEASLLVFDLSRLPDDARLLLATLELGPAGEDSYGIGLDWEICAVELAPGLALAELSLARLLELPESRPAILWRLSADAIALGQATRLDFDAEALAALSSPPRAGRLALRLRPRALAGAGSRGLVSWPATGDLAPRLRLAYLAATPAP